MAPGNPSLESHPVSRMPEELLCEVFLNVRSTYWHRFTLADNVEDFRPEGGRTKEDRFSLWHPHRWIMVSQVCRLWRHVAISCPRLWNHIIVTADDDRIAAFLQRSQRVPLEIMKSPTSDIPTSRYLGILNAHLDRVVSIEGLKIGVDDHEVLATTVDSELPLQSISMRANPDANFIPVISSAELTRLRRVDVMTITYLAVRNLLRPALTHLVLTDLYTPPSVEDWLTILCDMPALEELQLNGAILSQESSIITMPPSKRARLNNIRFIKLTDFHGEDGCACVNLACNLVFPSTASLILGTYEPLNDAPHIPMFQDFLHRLAPTKITCDYTGGKFSVLRIRAFGDDNPEQGRFELSTYCRRYAPRFIASIFSGLRLPSVVSFALRIFLGPWPEGTLASIGLSLPNVTRLELADTHAIEMFMDGAELLMKQNASQETKTGAKAKPPPFANLATLVITNIFWDEEYHGLDVFWKGKLFERLEDVLRRRQDAGLTIPLLLLEDAVHLGNFPEGPITDTVGRCIFNAVSCQNYDCPCMDDVS